MSAPRLASLAYAEEFVPDNDVTEAARWNGRESEQLDPALHVIADIGGVAEVAATALQRG